MEAVDVLPIVVGVVILLIIVFFVGGYIATGRRREALQARLKAELDAADAALAAARAGDRGWDRDAIESAAREAFAETHPGREIRELHLVQVVDKPGTDADEAVFRILADDGRELRLTLGRREGAWVGR